MAPPAKRRKRNVVDSDDEEYEAHQTRKNSLKNFFLSSPDPKGAASHNNNNSSDVNVSPSPVRKSTRSTVAGKAAAAANGPGVSKFPARLAASRNSTKSPSTSPEKKRGGKLDEKGKSGDLLALFSKQAQKALAEGKTNGKKAAEAPALDDIISDPISEEDDVGVSKASASSFVGKNAQKRSNGTQLGTTSLSSSSSGLPASSQRFLKPPGRTPTTSAPQDEDLRPWSERFGPANLDELAVHKKKVADVRKWLEDVMGGRMRQRLLVLKGAAGTGKTTTVQLLAKDMGCEILEWRNPAGSLGATQGYASASAQFEEFMGRGGKFGQLDFDTDPDYANGSTSNGSSTHDDSAHDPAKPKIITIEEFPNTFMRSSSGLTSFRKTILQYLALNTPSLAAFVRQRPAEAITPVVMIISETLLTTTSASADSFTAHRLLGPDILRHAGTTVIEFNAIAPTLLAKALELVVLKEARKSGRRRTPGPQVLRRLGEIGDIRNAVSSLEFLCVKGDDEADWGAKVAFTKGKKGPKDAALTKGERESLELVSQREASLGIFHAVGKVVYNKRDELPYPAGSEEALAETLPDYISHLSRPKRSQVAVDTLIDETGTDTHTFISALHENYALSCERTGPRDPQSSLDYINGCIEYLSESDLLCPSWDIFFGGKGFGPNFGRDSGSHVLRQDEMAFQTAVRGLLFSLPSPVKRQSTGSARGGDQFKMFYPTSIKLWRTKEELESLIDVWSSKMLNGELMQSATQTTIQDLTSGASLFRKNKTGDDRNDARKPGIGGPGPVQEKPEAADSAAPILISLGSSARKEMVLERLPYMAQIARRKKISFQSMGMRDLDKVVSFQGIGPPATEDSSDEGDEAAGPVPGEAWATDKPTEESSPRKKRVGAIKSKSKDLSAEDEDTIPGGLQVHKLVLSDDDIEDD
ncbi:uncharacterized protein E0L32_004311 [Thyridium curvatum]|uniref:Checkpoint protein RAD24-like helical bundle domain-containing protein n=1 Tax=Thyridium curvatum TaxID=1093900 RepID=A0A507B7E0_9PEZI|nr:uncharacterized protein E0L32_004311 [Thyridium curvatum]TPX15613.1 hypothetical protein E0L32_004311 [Thyridium curvatum]